MAQKKGGGSTRNGRDSKPKMLGVKVFGGQSISAHDHLEGVLPIPTLIVWGSKDRMIPAWHALSAQRALPECRGELFEGAGHRPHRDDPDRFARVLREFMAEA